MMHLPLTGEAAPSNLVTKAFIAGVPLQSMDRTPDPLRVIVLTHTLIPIVNPFKSLCLHQLDNIKRSHAVDRDRDTFAVLLLRQDI